MTSISTFIKDKPGWRWAIGVFVAGRLVLSLWALVIMQLNPLVVSQQVLYGTPVLAVFDPRANVRGVFSPAIDGRVYHFRPNGVSLVDGETGSSWTLAGQATSGPLTGQLLKATSFGEENVFPYRGVKPSRNPLLSPWQRFDTNWYLAIAERGYSAVDGSTVYFPMYPLLIRAVGFLLLGDLVLAGFVVSNLALVGVYYLLYEIARETVGARSAVRAVVFLALFPTAFFLLAAYTESVFLLFALGALREGMKAHWTRAALLAALAALTRLQGVLLILPLAYMWWQWYTQVHVAAGAGDKRLSLTGLCEGAVLLTIALPTLGFLLWQSLALGTSSLLTTYEGQLNAVFVMPWDNVLASLGSIAARQASLIDLLNLAITVLFGIMVVAVWKSGLPRWQGLYAASMLLAPLFRMTTAQPLVSMFRYVLVLFPVFILWGQWSEKAWVQRTVVYSSFALALYFSAQFVMWGWVG